MSGHVEGEGEDEKNKVTFVRVLGRFPPTGAPGDRRGDPESLRPCSWRGDAETIHAYARRQQTVSKHQQCISEYLVSAHVRHRRRLRREELQEPLDGHRTRVHDHRRQRHARRPVATVIHYLLEQARRHVAFGHAPRRFSMRSSVGFLLCTLSPMFTVARQICANGVARVITLTLFVWFAAIPCLDALNVQNRALEASDLCNSRWWTNATGASVQTLIRTGARAAEPCSNSREGDYPLHLAAVFGNDAGAVRALVNAGADTRAPNGAGETPVVLFTRRYEQAVLSFGRASQTLTAMSAVFDRQLEAVGAAQNSLCSLDWWRNPVRPNAEAAVKAPGVDLNASCDSAGNRPLHVALSLEHISEDTYNAITWLVYSGGGNIANRWGTDASRSRRA